MIDELRMRAFFAVEQGAEHWELIRDLAARIDALGERLARLEQERSDRFLAGLADARARVDVVVEPEASKKAAP